MNVILEISPEEEAAYEAQASSEGMSLQDWLKKLANERARPELAPGFKGKDFLAACEKIRGFADDLDFSRNPSTARPLDL